VRGYLSVTLIAPISSSQSAIVARPMALLLGKSRNDIANELGETTVNKAGRKNPPQLEMSIAWKMFTPSGRRVDLGPASWSDRNLNQMSVSRFVVYWIAGVVIVHPPAA
jgi:hypothetical protein